MLDALNKKILTISRLPTANYLTQITHSYEHSREVGSMYIAQR